MSRTLRAALGLVLGLALGWAAQAQTPPTPAPDAAARLDALVRLGDDWPDRAQAALAAWPTTSPIASPAEQRAVLLARAEVAQRSGEAVPADTAREAAVQAARPLSALLAEADQHYLQALRADLDDRASAPDLAERALAAYERHCAAAAAPAAAGAVCELRQRWRLHQLLVLRAATQRADDSARRHGLAALDLARSADDPWRLATSEGALALLAERAGDHGLSQQHLGRAQAQVRRGSDPGLKARLLMLQAQLARLAGQTETAQSLMQQALQQAQAADAARLQAALHGNLADLALRRQQPRQALASTELGLAIAQRLGDRRLTRLLQHNALLARLALGQTAAAHHDLDRLQTAWAAEGATGLQVSTLREFGDALAARGDAAGALAIHHRERQLNQQLMQANRDAALAELRGRFDSEAQQREMQLLARDNAVKSAELTRQGLAWRLWLLGGAVVALALVLTALLVLRVRETRRLLEASRIALRHQSERDALTGLANRRQVQAVLQHLAADAATGLNAGLLLIDIDHFKAVNDGRGHAAGDAVLVAVAQRLATAVRDGDTVARWGGEEFLVVAPALHGEALAALAQRLLQAIGGSAVALDGGPPLRVTASIGHAAFPLPPQAVPLRAEQAINLVDMALYLAKSQGRNRAVGITRAEAPDADALRALETDFERACAEGRVTLQALPGPVAG